MTTVAKRNKHYPPMTARDFWFVADVLASVKAERPSRNVIIEAFADELEHTNPMFNRDMFVRGCTPNK